MSNRTWRKREVGMSRLEEMGGGGGGNRTGGKGKMELPRHEEKGKWHCYAAKKSKVKLPGRK